MTRNDLGAMFEESMLLIRQCFAQANTWRHLDLLDDRADASERLRETGEHLGWLLRRAYRQILVLMELLQLGAARRRLEQEWSEFEGALHRVEYAGDDGDEPHSFAADLLLAHLTPLTTLLVAPNTIETEREVLRRVLVQLGVLLEQSSSKPKSEPQLQVLMEPWLKGPFPDVVREPKHGQQTKVYRPDFGVPSIRTAIELKFVTASESVGTAVGSVYEDMMAYSGSHEFDAFVALFYTTGAYVSQERIEAEWIRVGAPSNWKALLVIGPGGRISKAP